MYYLTDIAAADKGEFYFIHTAKIRNKEDNVYFSLKIMEYFRGS